MRWACVLLLIAFKAHQDDAATPSMTIKEIIRSYGYPVEEHRQIRTDDGYLLTLHRIPHGLHAVEREARPAVFLMHGILGSSTGFISMGPGFSIAYDLVEAGYDVWMGNARGNKFSRSHERLHPILNRKRFWTFSWHEIGYYDLPAMIDFVLMMTNQKKLSYIGHSQGTTTFFVMASTRKDYNKKISLMVALAPVVYMEHISNPLLQMLSKIKNPFKWAMNIFGWYEFLPGSNLFNLIGGKACNSVAVAKLMCTNVFFMIYGWDSQQLNKSTIPMIVAHTPAGAASLQFIHYAQGIKSGEFRQYDYGIFKNLNKYRSRVPPEYKLTKVDTPVSLVYADNDRLSSPRDVHRLKGYLRNVVDMYRVPFKKFTHLDYLFGVDVKKLVNDHVIDILRKYKE